MVMSGQKMKKLNWRKNMKKIFCLFIAFTLNSSISNADSTFSVNDCEIAKELLPEKSYSTIMEQKFLRYSIEAFLNHLIL